MKIVIQGIGGSFHHQAATEMFPGENPEMVACDNFRQVFEAIDNPGNDADYGLVAIENSLHGSINEVYRLFRNHNVWIKKDIRMQIGQNLVSHTMQSIEELKSKGAGLTVMSHPVALQQVDYWLTDNLPEATRREYNDTASSVELVMNNRDLNILAVAGNLACKMYGGVIVAPNIQDEQENYTRFVLFDKNPEATKDATHGSLIITTDHKPGSLLEVLNVFSDNGCNMTKLDSHPIASDKQHYDFYIDYELNDNNDELIRSIISQGCKVKNLGQYQHLG